MERTTGPYGSRRRQAEAGGSTENNREALEIAMNNWNWLKMEQDYVRGAFPRLVSLSCVVYHSPILSSHSSSACHPLCSPAALPATFCAGHCPAHLLDRCPGQYSRAFAPSWMRSPHPRFQAPDATFILNLQRFCSRAFLTTSLPCSLLQTET